MESPEVRFNSEEASEFKKSWLAYARRLLKWRWTGEDTAFPKREGEYQRLTSIQQMQHGILHQTGGCVDPLCGFPAPEPKAPESKPAPFSKGTRKSNLRAEAVTPPSETRALAVIEQPPLRLTEAGIKPLEGVLNKSLAVLGGTAAVGAVVIGGVNLKRGVAGYTDPQTGEHQKGDLGHLLVGTAEVGLGAAGLLAALTGRVKFWGPVQAPR
jgi:hypothetical protein